MGRPMVNIRSKLKELNEKFIEKVNLGYEIEELATLPQNDLMTINLGIDDLDIFVRPFFLIDYRYRYGEEYEIEVEGFDISLGDTFIDSSIIERYHRYMYFMIMEYLQDNYIDASYSMLYGFDYEEYGAPDEY